HRARVDSLRHALPGRRRARLRHAGDHPRHDRRHPGPGHSLCRGAGAHVPAIARPPLPGGHADETAAGLRAMDANAIIPVRATTIRASVPPLLACLAGLYSERSGVFDIGLEGKMLVAAFAAGAAAAAASADAELAPFAAWLGLGAAIIVSIVFALVH